MKLFKYLTIITVICIIFVLGNAVAFSQSSGNTSADVTFTSGTLTLSQMSTFGFGNQTISGTAQSYPAVESAVYLDVHDLRGTGVGWKVTALCSQFTSSSNPTLPGSVIALSSGSSTTTQPGGGNPPTVQPAISLDTDGASSQQIATATTGQGLGNWRIEWNGAANNNTNATLTVPGGVATTGTHTATITWTLADAP